MVFAWEMNHKVSAMSRGAFFSSPAHVLQLLILLLDAAGIIVSTVSARYARLPHIVSVCLAVRLVPTGMAIVISSVAKRCLRA